MAVEIKGDEPQDEGDDGDGQPPPSGTASSFPQDVVASKSDPM
jgi:hypothetical protein